MFLKRTMLVLLALAFVIGLMTGCNVGPTDPKDFKGKIVLWSFTDEVQKMIPYFKKAYPNLEVESTIIPMADESYPNKVQQAFRAGDGGPDVMTAEIAFMRKFIDSGFFEDISSAPYNAEELTKDLIKYQVDLARDSKGHMRAISWQATAGGLFYRRSLAKQFFGTDDPAEVGKKFASFDAIIDASKVVKDKSKGKVSLFADYGELWNIFRASRQKQWIVDGKLNIEKPVLDYFDVALKLRAGNLTAKVGQWSPPWFNGMKDKSIVAYVLPTWGLHYVLKPNAEADAAKAASEGKSDPKFTGDWAVTTGPASYFWGGTWAGVNAKSKNKAAAWEFVKFITTNVDFLKEWAKTTGDFLGNQKVVDEIAPTFSEPFLGGQNHYAYFKGEAAKINGNNVGPSDQQIEGALGNEVSLFVDGKKTKEQAIADFKKAVKSILPDVSVE
jgi:multiple sugar transport system substrate-binding protein